MTEENTTLPAKIGGLAMHALTIVKDTLNPTETDEDKVLTATETDEEHDVVTDTGDDSVDEDIADDDPLHEVCNNELEMIIDQAIKSCKEKGKPSNGIPELVFCIPCIHPEHKVTNTLDKGYFSIKGN